MARLSISTAIPKKILDLFPPRAFNYGRTRESFKSKTGVAFDPFGAVETASAMTLGILLHPERVTRLVQHNSLDSSQLGLVEVLDDLIANSFQKMLKTWDLVSNGHVCRPPLHA